MNAQDAIKQTRQLLRERTNVTWIVTPRVINLCVQLRLRAGGFRCMSPVLDLTNDDAKMNKLIHLAVDDLVAAYEAR